MTLFSLRIDEYRCWGCRTCEVACRQEMGSPAGVDLISVVEDGPRMVDGEPFFIYRVRACRHCDLPDCVDACPEKAITKRPDGIVILDGSLCSGCRACLDACPFDAIAFDPERETAQKCNLCFHRVDRGLLPACADNICLAHCIFFSAAE
jgi:Fe-S-cluster-containing dehydrogenase component